MSLSEVDRFNAVLAYVAAEHRRFVHVDLRGTVGTEPEAWVNEIHPSREGFRRAAKVMIELVARRHPGVGRVNARCKLDLFVKIFATERA